MLHMLLKLDNEEANMMGRSCASYCATETIKLGYLRARSVSGLADGSTDLHMITCKQTLHFRVDVDTAGYTTIITAAACAQAQAWRVTSATVSSQPCGMHILWHCKCSLFVCIQDFAPCSMNRNHLCEMLDVVVHQSNAACPRCNTSMAYLPLCIWCHCILVDLICVVMLPNFIPSN